MARECTYNSTDSLVHEYGLWVYICENFDEELLGSLGQGTELKSQIEPGEVVKLTRKNIY